MLLLVYVLTFLIYIISFKRIKEKPIFRLILILYFGSMCAAFYLWNYTEIFTSDRFNKLSLAAIIYHTIILMVMLYPLSKYESNIHSTNLPFIRYSQFSPFLYILIIISLVSILTSISIMKNLSGMTMIELRSVLITGEGREIKSTSNLISYISFFAIKYSIITLFCFFYTLIVYPKKKILIVLLFISSLCSVIANLEVGGREQILRYLFNFTVVFFLLKSQMTIKQKKIIKRTAFVFASLMIIIFMMISISRFGANSRNEFGILNSLLSYYGQGFIYFSNFFETFKEGAFSGQLKFSVFSGGHVSSFNTNEYLYVSIPTNIFTTYVGSFVIDLGIYKALIPVIIFTALFHFVSRMKANSIFTYIYILWIFDFFFSGMFYFIDTINGSHLLSILIIILINTFVNLNKKVPLSIN